MKASRITHALIATLCLGIATNAEAADYGPPDKLTFGFDDLTEWQGLESTLDLAREGVQGGLWKSPSVNTRVRTRNAKVDLGACDSVSFLVHSARAEGGTFAIVMKSENDEVPGPDYYFTTVTVNWEGWSEVTRPFGAFEAHGTPQGWHHIDEVGFASSGFGLPTEPIRGDLALDAMTFPGGPELAAEENEAADADVPDEFAAVFGFEDFEAWRGLVPDSEDPREGAYSGRWQGFEDNKRVQCNSFPRDLSGSTAIQVDIHSQKADPGSFALILMSENETTEGIDYYLANIPVDWSGWKVVTIPFGEMDLIREPAGLASIDSLRMASTGYRIKVTLSDTVLKFDNLRLISAPK